MSQKKTQCLLVGNGHHSKPQKKFTLKILLTLLEQRCVTLNWGQKIRLDKSKPRIYNLDFYILCNVFKSDLQMIIKSTFVTTDTILSPVHTHNGSKKSCDKVEFEFEYYKYNFLLLISMFSIYLGFKIIYVQVWSDQGVH